MLGSPCEDDVVVLLSKPQCESATSTNVLGRSQILKAEVLKSMFNSSGIYAGPSEHENRGSCACLVDIFDLIYFDML